MIPLSERKTTEIKFRTSPTWKARVQSAAADADESLSEFIEKAVDDRMRAEQKQRDEYIESIVSTSGVKARRGWSFPTATERDQATQETGRGISITDSAAALEGAWGTNGIVANYFASFLGTTNLTDTTPQKDVPTSDDESHAEGNGTHGAVARYGPRPLKSEKQIPRPWMFEARSGE